MAESGAGGEVKGYRSLRWAWKNMQGRGLRQEETS